MSTTNADELNSEMQEHETQEIPDLQETGESESIAQAETEDAPQPEKKKRTYTRREPVTVVREPGKSLLPFSRVQKIIKADKEIPIIAKDATFLISLATEEFIKRLVEAGKMVAEREKRATVQHKDIGVSSAHQIRQPDINIDTLASATVVRRADEFLFLEEIIPWMSADPPAKRKPRGAGAAVKGQPTMDHFVIDTKRAEDEDIAEQADIIMNEDGTMGAAGGGSEDEFE
ncbi:hypothetical protein DXG01_007116 [Tephrocybe rancida]|nr:hypothetical protein DXG01_007116 [Tephrocybe rancida]